MSSPARDARLLAASKGFTQVIGRGSAHIVTRNPTTGKCAYDGQVGGGWHYGAVLETDTAWVTGVAPWNYQITKANYNLFALSQLNQGQILKWLDPASGRSITFQPMALQWTNALNQIQQISMPQSVAAQVSDDVLYWPSGYGSGRHFKYVASPSRLNKLLIIDSAASLPATSYDALELNFIIGMSAGVTPYIDSGSGLAAWNKITQKDTVKAIEFRLSNGNVVWSFAVPTAYDSSGLPEGATAGTMRLKKQGRSLYVSVRFPKSWIDTAVFPIMLDPTLDYQTGASGDDGYWYSTVFNNNAVAATYGFYTRVTHHFYRWTGISIPVGSTITAAKVSCLGHSAGGAVTIPDGTKLHFCHEANPSAPTSVSACNALALTTAYVKPAMSPASTWFDHPDMSAALQELIDAHTITNAAIMAVLKSVASDSYNYGSIYFWDQAGNVSGPKLHIEYTEASTSSWAGTWGG